MNIKKWADDIITRAPIGIAEMMSKIAPLIPCFHMVSNERIAHVCHLYSYKNERQFISDIEFLCIRYHPVSITDVIDHVQRGKSLKNGSFLLTFDDGYSQMYSVVSPILLKMGIPAAFFLSTDFIDNKSLSYRNKASLLIDYITDHEAVFHKVRHKLPPTLNVPIHDLPKRILSISYGDARILDELAGLCGFQFEKYLENAKPFLSKEQILKMIDMGFYFGAHSLDHPLYADLSFEEQLHQTIASLEFIKREFRLRYSLFAFPLSDRSVSREFFDQISGRADLTFGNSGIKTDSIPSNLQRINFEKTLEPAKVILTREFIKKRIYRWLRKSQIERT